MRIFLPALATIALATLVLLGSAGCGTDSNSVGPGVDPPEEEILTPVSMRLDKIVLNTFPEKKGSVTWDAGISVSSRRPDVYVEVQLNSSSATPTFVSTVDDDAFSGVFREITEAGEGSNLPRTISASNEIFISVFDEDTLSADDLMGRISFDAIDIYRGENEAGFSINVTDGESTVVRISGAWIY